MDIAEIAKLERVAAQMEILGSLLQRGLISIEQYTRELERIAPPAELLLMPVPMRLLEHGAGQVVPSRPFVHRRRRPCPTAIPHFDGPPSPSPCAERCVCCAVCRGEGPPGVCSCSWRTPVAMPIPGPYDHPGELAKAIVAEKPGAVERFWRWLMD